MIKGNKCNYVFFIFIFLGFSWISIYIILEVTEKVPKCYNPTISETDELQIGNQTFSKEEFEKINETHFGICLENKVPVLRKCCGENEILQFGKKSCVSHENIFETNLVIHDENDQELPNYDLTYFHRQYGMIECPSGKYLLNLADPSDVFKFRKDGTLFIQGETSNGTETSDVFCLDVTETENGTYLQAFVCYPKEDTQPHLILYTCGMIISMPFLLAIFLFHALIKELRTLHGFYVMSHSASLLIFYIFLAITQIDGTRLGSFCTICGYIIQFFFLAAFFWLNVMCADMWFSIKSFRPIERGNSGQTERKKFVVSCCYGWGGPLVIVIISLTMDLIPAEVPKPDVGKTMCLIDTNSNKLSGLYYLYGPMGILIALNLFFFISTAMKISFIEKKTRMMFGGKESCCNKQQTKQFTVYLKLFITMGIAWLFEILSWAAGGPRYIWYIPDFSNSLQGLYIFMIFLPKITAVFKKRRRNQNSNSTRSISFGRSRKSSSSSGNNNKNNGENNVKLVSVKCKNESQMHSLSDSLLSS